MTNLHGIIPNLVTTFNAAERFRPQAFEALLRRVYSAGVHGVYVWGQTGEGLLQPVEQRKRVAEVAVQNSPVGTCERVLFLGYENLLRRWTLPPL